MAVKKNVKDTKTETKSVKKVAAKPASKRPRTVLSPSSVAGTPRPLLRSSAIPPNSPTSPLVVALPSNSSSTMDTSQALMSSKVNNNHA